MKRFGSITKIKTGMLEEYTELHNKIWDEVVAAGHNAGLRNFTIFHNNGYLFSYFEYVGDDYAADMGKKNSLPVVKKWQEICGRYFDTIDGKTSIPFEEIFHNDF